MVNFMIGMAYHPFWKEMQSHGLRLATSVERRVRLGRYVVQSLHRFIKSFIEVYKRTLPLILSVVNTQIANISEYFHI